MDLSTGRKTWPELIFPYLPESSKVQPLEISWIFTEDYPTFMNITKEIENIGAPIVTNDNVIEIPCNIFFPPKEGLRLDLFKGVLLPASPWKSIPLSKKRPSLPSKEDFEFLFSKLIEVR